MEKEVQFNQVYNYLNSFLSNIRHDDPLPVRAPNYKITDSEIDGQIINIVLHYLNNRECPPYIRSLVAHRVWAQLRDFDSEGEDALDSADHNLPVYESVKLIHDVTNRANVVLKELHSKLSPKEVESMPTYMAVSTYSIKNSRRKMEDRHIVIHDLNTLYNLEFGYPHAFYGVYDGHGGVDAAIYASAHLHQYLIQNPLYEMDPIAALKHAFHITDTNFVKKVAKEKLNGGTTAVVALVREKRLVVAWLGDSQALLVRRRKPVQVVSPHKPDYEAERNRIEELGGCVINIQGTWRVLGQLAVSRAIGDADYKPFVSSECDIKSLEINGDEDFLILGCDGLWEGIEGPTAVNIVYSYLRHNDGDTDGVGRCLVDAAKKAGSFDNITAVVVFLRPVNILMEEEAIRIAQGEVTAADQVAIDSKPNQPNFITDIFSPPLKQESNQKSQHEEPDLRDGIPIPEPFKDDQLISPPAVSSEVPASHESDSDEGIDAEKNTDFPQKVTDPTAAEVDAALAELDSLSGDADGSSDDEEWVYEKPKDQNIEKEETDESSVNNMGTIDSQNLISTSPPKSPDMLNQSIPSQPGSPRSVEGFVTSVELNTPTEIFSTNLAINQSTEFISDAVESGPFSVYVSSSPEPGSTETDPIQHQSAMQDDVSDTQSNVDLVTSTGQDYQKTNDVEIVHAQSMVEVTPSDSPISHEFVPMPDIMTQSFTGDQLPEHPYDPAQVIASMTESLTELSKEQFNGHLENQTVVTHIEPESIDADPILAREICSKPVNPDITNEANLLADQSKLSTDINETANVIQEPFTTPSQDEAASTTQYGDAFSPLESTSSLTEDIKDQPAPIQCNDGAALLESEVPIPEPKLENSSVTDAEVPTSNPNIEDASLLLDAEVSVDQCTVKETTPEEFDVTEKSSIEPVEKIETFEPVTPTNTPKEPPKPAARTTSLTTSSRPRVTKTTTREPMKTTRSTKTVPKLEEKKPAASRISSGKTVSKPALKSTTASKTTTRSTISTTKPTTTKAFTSSTASRLATKKPTTTTTSATTTKPTTTRLTSTTTTKRVPLSTRPTSGTKSTSPAVPTTTPSTKTTTTTTTRRVLPGPRPTATSLARTSTATKDTKNTTNKMISSNTTASSKVATKPRPICAKTTSTTTQRRPISNTKTNISGIKSKIDTGRTITKKKIPTEVVKSPDVNGENKIAEEETAIEIKEKLLEENGNALVNGSH